MTKNRSQSLINSGIITALVVIVSLGCTDNQITEYTNEAIKNSTQLQELDKVCKEIPLPEDFQFVSKGGLDDQKLTLSYHYVSKTKYEETWKLLKEYFTQKNWRLVRDEDGAISSIKIVEFTDDSYRIVVQHGGMRSIDYGVDCEKLK